MTRLKSFPSEEVQLNTKIYDEYHHNLHWEDGWDKKSKEYNFEKMFYLTELTTIPLAGTSCLDVGCGSGDLCVLLRKKGIRRYVGVDIYDPSLERARKKYPDEDFRHADILAGDITEVFDYAFCSGTLTLKLSTIDNYDFLESLVAKMWELTRIGVVFNILTIDPEPDPDLFFYDNDRVISICKEIVQEGHVVTFADKEKEQSHFFLYR